MSTLHRIIFWISAGTGLVLMFWSAQDAFELLSGERIGASACTINDYWNCDRATMSLVGSWFSFPVGLFGAIWFGCAALFHAAGSRFLRPWLLAGIAVAIFMGSYLIFVIKAGCVICYSTYFLIALMAITGWKSAKEFLPVRFAFIGMALLVTALALFAGVKKNHVATRISSEEFERWYQREESIPVISTLKRGAESAKLTVVEFSDFGCPFCGKATEVLEPFLLDQPDIAFVFYPYPLDSECNPAIQRQVHPHSCEWTRAVFCAERQNKAWQLHDELFKRIRRGEHLVGMNEWFPDIGLDRAALELCMESGQTKETIAAWIRVGNELHVESTPTFFLNGRRFPGVVPIPVVQKLLEKVRSR